MVRGPFGLLQLSDFGVQGLWEFEKSVSRAAELSPEGFTSLYGRCMDLKGLTTHSLGAYLYTVTYMCVYIYIRTDTCIYRDAYLYINADVYMYICVYATLLLVATG